MNKQIVIDEWHDYAATLSPKAKRIRGRAIARKLKEATTEAELEELHDAILEAWDRPDILILFLFENFNSPY